MSFQSFKEDFRFHQNKYLAVFFSSLALALLLSDFLLEVILIAEGYATLSWDSPLSLWNYVVLGICYSWLLVGNLRNDNRAYSGLLMFVFMSFVGSIESLFYFELLNFRILFSKDAVLIALALVLLGILILEIVAGIMTFVRIRQYLSRRYFSYKGVWIWCLVFVVFTVASNCLWPIIYAIEGTLSSTWTLVLLPLSEAFAAVACFFTTLRLPH
jgi:hypothetical protein